MPERDGCMRRIYNMSTGVCGDFAVRDAASCLAAGALALLPTETVYGVGVAVAAYGQCAELPVEGSGYRRIFSLKRRELTQTVPWLVADESALDRYGVDVPCAAHVLAHAFWPGALTIVVKASDEVPLYMQAADGTVALRASACRCVQHLVRACDSPLAVTSANTHGMPAPASFEQVEQRILAGVDLAIDGGKTVCQEASTIVSCEGGQITLLRVGALAQSDLEAALRAAEINTPIRKGC